MTAKQTEATRDVLVKFYLPEPFHRRLKAAAASQGLTMGEMVAVMVERDLPQFEVWEQRKREDKR